MNTSFPKYKEKRPRPSSSENSNSFVKNVTSRVSGLLPATITKWFSSPSSSSANGSAPTAEITDSSTEDEGPETPVVTQPPAKRMRFNTSNKFNHFGATEPNCTTNNLEITEIPVSHFPGTPYSTSRNNLSLSQIRSPIEIFTNEPMKDKLDKDSSRFKSRQHTVSNIGKSVAAKRKSIFDRTSNEDTTKPNAKSPKEETKRPSFKPTLLGSPFYPGSTIYGGAASSYVNQPNIQQHTVALVNESKGNEDSTMSSSARRVMDLLESYSSPLMEARRIPHYTKPKIESFYSANNTSSPYENRSLSYKTQELNVPSIASILRLKQRSRLMDSTRAARQIIASHSSASTPYPLINSSATTKTSEGSTTECQSWPASKYIDIKQNNQDREANKMTTKVKARVTRTNRGQDPFDMNVSVQLPAATLQIDQNKLPTFSFDPSPVTSTPKVNPVPKTDQVKSNTEISTSKSATDTSSNMFKFSNPVQVSCDTPVPDTTPPKFTFDSPERRIEKQQCTSTIDVSSVVGNVKETDKTTNKAKDWQCPDCWVNNKSEVTKCVCCGYKQQQKAVKAAKCVVCKLADSQTLKDKCINCEKMASPPAAKSSQSTKWKCGGCWIMNEDSVGKCPCCGESKPNEVGKAPAATELATFPKVKTPSGGSGFTFGGSQINPVPKDAKPLQLPSNSTTFFGSNNQGDNAFVSLAKTQKSDKWECSSCLVMNASHETACVCCAAERNPKSKLPESKFGFALNTNTSSSFKFGIDPKVQEVTLAKKPEVQLTPESKLKRISETNNNVLPEAPTFTFSLPAKKTETKIDAEKEKPLEPVKFSFGMPKTTNATANLSQPTKSANEDEEKLQEVPQMKNSEKLAAAIEEKPKPTGFFAAPLTQTVQKDKPLVPTSSLFTLPTVEAKKDVSSIPITPQPTVTSVEKPPTQSPFALKLASNLFATTTTASNSGSAILFSSPGQSSATTTSASNVSSMLPVAPMQKSEAPSLTLPAPTLVAPAASAPALPVPAAPASSAPIFSFGSNGLNNPTPSGSTVTSAEKPSVQFTFGSNNSTKTDSAPSLLTSSNSQPVFKSLFAPVSVNNAKNTNAFSLTSANTLLPSNALTSNTLTGSNGISATNGLVGNTLSASPMGSNGLSGNMLSTNTMASNTFASNSLTGGNGASSGTLGGTNGLSGNTLAGGSGLQTSNTLTNNSLPANPSNMFVNVQKENMWNPNPNNNTPSNNMFTSNTTTNSLQKPAAFTFGTSTQFNATSPSPAFGNTAQPAPNIFGMGNQNNSSQPSLFSSPVQNQSPAPMFGSPQPNNNTVPQMGMFGTSSLGAAPAFGAPSASINSFETASMTPAPAPAFTFGAQAQTPMFGFGQQQSQQQQDQSSAVYSFGSTAQPVQFNMGTANNTASRRIRKAARRTPR